MFKLDSYRLLSQFPL